MPTLSEKERLQANNLNFPFKDVEKENKLNPKLAMERNNKHQSRKNMKLRLEKSRKKQQI